MRLWFLLGFVFIAACSTSPTGRHQLLLYSDSQMADMGAASFQQIKQQNPPSTDTKQRAEVYCISTALLIAAGENPALWEVQVFNDKTPNAFALPGRKIGIHTGMLSLVDNGAQLAAVIGHEIAHVKAHHSAERLSMNSLMQMGQQLGNAASEGHQNQQLIMAAIGLGAQYGVLLPYSRTQESEADLIGLMLMAQAGFDPKQSVALWQKMKQAGTGAGPEFMSTHPSDDRRIDQLNAAMQSALALYQNSSKAHCQLEK